MKNRPLVSVPQEDSIDPYEDGKIYEIDQKVKDSIKKVLKKYRAKILQENNLFKRYEQIDDLASLLEDSLPEKDSDLLKDIEMRLTKTKNIYSIEDLENTKTIQENSDAYNKIRGHLNFIDINSVILFHNIKELLKSKRGKLGLLIITQQLTERLVSVAGEYGAKTDMMFQNDAPQEFITDLRQLQLAVMQSLTNDAFKKDFGVLDDKKTRRRRGNNDTNHRS